MPEWTQEDFAQARSFAETFPGMAEKIKNKGGRPKAIEPKKQLTLRVAARLADAITRHGRGYNARAEAVLQQALDEGRL